MPEFKLVSEFTPKGDQPNAIKILSKGVDEGKKHQVLLGVTGSGKTFTMAHVINNVNKSTLVIAPNKTLAAQLYNELKLLFPQNAVEYFVSYYDYYQPEAYLPQTDVYIQKDSSINDMIDKMRHSATRSVLSRDDVIVVASISCIFGLGDPEDYLAMCINIEMDMEIDRDKLLSDFVSIQYSRNDMDFHRGVFRVRGDRVEIFPTYEDDIAIRIEFFGDLIEGLYEIDPLRGTTLKSLKKFVLYPASHYVIQKKIRDRALKSIVSELKDQVEYFRNNNRLIEAQRIEERTNYDIEMIREIGFCSGIENYSRHFTGRQKGEHPPTLLEYFPDDYLIFFDESHISIPQLSAMYKGDKARKQTLVEYGFRLPSALDNRPLTFEEYEAKSPQVIYVSATPADYELEKSQQDLVEQIVRPTGLLDPEVKVKSARYQVDDLLEEIRKRIEINERVLVTTLTKRMSEDLTEYYTDLGIRARYLHSDISTLERIDIIHDLRLGQFDVLVGINLLREGLDIPEVSLVAIMDADKEGFLRSIRSLIQTCGRAARNSNGMVIMYADKITKSMKRAIDETKRRRKIQKRYNKKHNITPTTIKKEISDVFQFNNKPSDKNKVAETIEPYNNIADFDEMIARLEMQMKKAAENLEFEKAAMIRDNIKELKKNNGI